MHVGQERRPRILAGHRLAATRHVELLLDDAGADGREADDQRDHLQVPRLAQQRDRFARADALLVLAGDARLPARFLADGDRADDARSTPERARGDEQQVVRADCARVAAREARPAMPPRLRRRR